MMVATIAGDRPEAEQEEDRHQIGEDRHGLHQVEDRPHRPLERRPAIAGEAEEQAAGDADRHRDQDRGERQHRALPLAEDGEIEEADADQHGEPPAAGMRGRAARRSR